jgi:predicted nucleic acid-binding protein
MKAYWDASALIEALGDPELRQRLKQDGGLTRSHSLAETFSALTGGNINLRVAPDKAAEMVTNIANDLSFFDLAPADVIAALKQAKARGVRGGRVHDFLHAVAAEKSGAKQLLTLDRNDFADLTDTVTVEQV